MTKREPWTRLLCALLGLAALAAGAAVAQAEIRTETVEYRQGDAVLEGFLAYDDAAEGRRPGVLVFHEWMGIDDYTRSRVQQLAREGYVAFAADIYGKGVRPGNAEEAGRVSGRYGENRPLVRERARAGLEQLRRSERVDADKVAAIGYCFGGMVALELARSGADVDGVVTFHGALDTPHPEDARNIRAKVLVEHGSADPIAPMEQVVALTRELDQAGVDWQLHLYGGAKHGFTNPIHPEDGDAPIAYDPDADQRSWQAMRLFLDGIFR